MARLAILRHGLLIALASIFIAALAPAHAVT